MPSSPNEVAELDFTNIEQRQHQWVDQHGTLWRWSETNQSHGWQYLDEDNWRWRYHGLSLHLYGPYRVALPHERCDDEATSCSCGAFITCHHAVGIDAGNTKYCPYNQGDTDAQASE